MIVFKINRCIFALSITIKLKTMNNKKITLATVKSFIKKNSESIYVKLDSSFDGMIDGLNWNKDASFIKSEIDLHHPKHTLGIKGAWFVGSSRDYFYNFENENFLGIKVSNSCGQFYLAIKK